MTLTKHIIGLTGNIATGKSVIRRMLVNHGALGIDADVIAHRILYAKGTAYAAVVQAFGEEILSPNGEISRGKLAEIVFKSPNRLRQLEKLTHPAVSNAIWQRIEENRLSLAVIEAIKLFESPLADLCDPIWVSHASEAQQLERLLQTRNMNLVDAQRRIAAQPPQSEKLSRADLVIYTEGSFEDTWRQIHTALSDTIQISETQETPNINSDDPWWIQPAGWLPAPKLKTFWEASASAEAGDLYEMLAFRVALPIMQAQEIRHLLIWDNWNFTGKLEQVIPTAPAPEESQMILSAFEAHVRLNQCELVMVPEALAALFGPALPALGFAPLRAGDLPYPAWQQALASEQVLWAKVIAQPVEIAGDD